MRSKYRFLLVVRELRETVAENLEVNNVKLTPLLNLSRKSLLLLYDTSTSRNPIRSCYRLVLGNKYRSLHPLLV